MLCAFFYGCKFSLFRMKNLDILIVFSLSIDCLYSFEPPHWDVYNEYWQSMSSWDKEDNKYRCDPQFSLYKVRFLGFILHEIVNDIGLFFHSSVKVYWYRKRL